MFNWTCFMNYAYQEKPYRPHVHWHLRPRYERAVTIAGVTCEDPTFGHPYGQTASRVLEPAVFQGIREKIKARL